MKHLKTYETKKWEYLMIGLQKGDRIVCVDPSGGLKYGEKFTIKEIIDDSIDEEYLDQIENLDNFVFVEKNNKTLYTRAFRFIPEENFGDYKIDQEAKKYNL